MYLSKRTRLDIAYAISRISKYTSNPNMVHWTTLESVFQYLKGTIDYSLHFIDYPNVLERYSDSY